MLAFWTCIRRPYVIRHVISRLSFSWCNFSVSVSQGGDADGDDDDDTASGGDDRGRTGGEASAQTADDMTSFMER